MHLALVLNKSKGAPRDSIKTADDAVVLATFAETGISASDLAEAETLEVTVCLVLWTLHRARRRPLRACT